MIRSDLKSKLRAALIEVRNIRLAAEASRLFGEIRGLEIALASLPTASAGEHKELLKGYQRLLNLVNSDETAQPEHKDVATRERITSLTTELGVYLYYCSTLLEFFGAESCNVERLKQAERSGALDHLCRARQCFTISPIIAESVITHFRKMYDMGMPSAAWALSPRPAAYAHIKVLGRQLPPLGKPPLRCSG